MDAWDLDLGPFELDAQLANDCFVMGDFPLSRLLLLNDANYPWFILVPRRAEVTEIYHLSLADQQQLLKESSFLAETLADTFAAQKMNVAALGNVVSQLHIHHVVRHHDDPSWPAPVWGKVPAIPYTDEQVSDIRHKLEALLSGEMTFAPEQK